MTLNRSMMAQARYTALYVLHFIVCTCCLGFPVTQLARQSPANRVTTTESCSGEWAAAKLSLRNPNCCVVSVSGLDHHLSILQQYFCGPDAPSDLDLRAKVRCCDELNSSYQDCSKIYKSIMEPSSLKDHVDEFGDDANLDTEKNNPCILALEALARGVALMADGPLENVCNDVHMRIVFASNYEAKDPMFHTDKCPLRGYVTLTGPGTEYMDRTCLPWEYAALRALGTENAATVNGLRMANELEFIVMKGDKYDAPLPEHTSPSIFQSILGKVWTRDAACVHRSPPAGDGRAKRRVILSLDLADGDDNQEWYEYNKKRGWRSGMTQRKSRLVA